jgi:hypothetical protein
VNPLPLLALCVVAAEVKAALLSGKDAVISSTLTYLGAQVRRR